MYKEFYEGSSLLGYPLFALLFFVAVFLVAVVGTLRRSRRQVHDSLAQLPLNDDPGSRPGGSTHVRPT